MTYSEKLKSPLWQRRRLEIMKRDDFTCQLCGDKETKLNVHHKVYRKCEVWDYSDDELITYCQICHLIVENFKDSEENPTILFIEKDQSIYDSNKISIFCVLDIEGKNYLSIMSYEKNEKVLNCIVTISKKSLIRMGEIVEEITK